MAWIFLCHASEDATQVLDVYHRLLDARFEVWMDKMAVLHDQLWVQEILQYLGTLVRRISSRDLIFTGVILCVIGGLAFGTRQILDLIAAWRIMKRMRNLERR